MPVSSKLLDQRVILICEVIDILYCGVIVKAAIDGVIFYFVIEKYPQNPMQGTKPVDASSTKACCPSRSNVVKEEAQAYWISNVKNNADGTRKGGAFALANFSLKEDIFIGSKLKVEIVRNTDINTEVLVSHGDAPPFKAYACVNASPQFAVDTYIMCLHKFVLYIRVIKRAAAGPDFPGGWAIIGGFVNGGQTVDQSRREELRQEGGMVIGDNTVKVLELGERNSYGRETRYMPFTYVNAAGELITFGCERGSTANAVVHFVIPTDTTQLPHLAEATDKAEVVKGEWMPLSDFLAMSNDPAAGDYVAWPDHQAGARDAAELLKARNLA